MTDTTVLEPPQTTALTIPARAAIALGSDKARIELAALVLKSKDVQAINSAAGRDEAHSFAMALVRARTAITKISKDARDEATKFRNAIIEEEAKLVAITEPEEKRLLALRDAWDAKVAAEKAAKAAAERARITAIHERIASIRNYHTLALECRTAERIKALLDKMTAVWVAFNFEDDFEEFGTEAQGVFDATKLRISELLAQKQADEAERARVKAEQEAEAARIKVEREALAAEQAKAKAQADAEAAELAAARAELQRQRDQIAAERAELERTQREAREAAELAAYEAAIAVQKEPETPVECAQEATETAATEAPMPTMEDPVADEVLVLSGAMVEVTTEPVRPSDIDMVKAVADAFNTDYITALGWMESIDFHELNR